MAGKRDNRTVQMPGVQEDWETYLAKLNQDNGKERGAAGGVADQGHVKVGSSIPGPWNGDEGEKTSR